MPRNSTAILRGPSNATADPATPQNSIAEAAKPRMEASFGNEIGKIRLQTLEEGASMGLLLALTYNEDIIVRKTAGS